MDANKRQVLVDIGYKVVGTCGICRFGVFVPHTDWGVCEVHSYSHKKHTEKDRHLSINVNGWCPMFESRAINLGGYAEFLDV